MAQEALDFAAALRSGLAAARAMWRRSRDPRVRGPNERVLAEDARRLAAWRRWLARAVHDPAIAWQATPVCGAWQLQFEVHHFAPAMQLILVEQRRADGTWRPLHRCHLIEFRAFAARPRTTILREFSVPVTVADAPTAEPGSALRLRSGQAPPAAARLRIAVRGLGQVGVSNVVLTNGVASERPSGWPATAKKILGRPAPRRGFPELVWTVNRGEVRLEFGPWPFSDSPAPASPRP